jgi:DNA-binding MarR family transcriptional regulator
MSATVQSGPRYPALLDLLHTAEALWNASRVFFAQWNLSPSQFNVLNLVHDRPRGMSQAELSRELIMHRSNVTGLVDRLEKRGLVVRRASAMDRREWRVVATRAGQALMRRILPLYYQVTETVWGNIPEGRALGLAEDLRELRERANALGRRYGGTL